MKQKVLSFLGSLGIQTGFVSSRSAVLQGVSHEDGKSLLSMLAEEIKRGFTLSNWNGGNCVLTFPE